MTFWKVDSLAHKLKTRNLSSAESFFYVLLYSLLLIVFTGSWIQETETFHSIAVFELVTDVAICLIGMFYLYQLNKKADDYGFIERFVCLSFPVGIQATVFSIISVVLLFFVYSFYIGEIAEGSIEERVFYTVVGLVWQLAFYYLMQKWFRYFAEK